MSVLIAGSRSPKNPFAARLLVDEMVQRLPLGMVVLNGGAAGIDEYVLDSVRRLPHGRVHDAGLNWSNLGFPQQHEVCAVVFRADWKRHGKAAGILRNLHMLDLKPEMVVVLWNGESPGSRQVAEEANRRGIQTQTIVT
jgi:hypothetical protein